MPLALSQTDIDQLETYKDLGVAGLTDYYGLLESEEYEYATLALGVVTGTGSFGAAARKFAENVGAITGEKPSMSSGDWNAIAVGLMERDFAARQTMFNNGQPIVDITFQTIKTYHSDVFDINGLPPEAWTMFAPTEVGSPSEGEQEAIWDDVLALGTGSTAQQFIAAAGFGLITLFNGVLDFMFMDADEQLAALWTEAVFFGPDRDNPTGAIKEFLGGTAEIEPYDIAHPDGW